MPPLLSQCFNDPFDVAQELPGMGRWAKGQVNQERDEFFFSGGAQWNGGSSSDEGTLALALLIGTILVLSIAHTTADEEVK